MITINGDYSGRLDKYTFIDLFAGIGGFRLALESFGGSCIYSSEWDAYAQKVYYDNFKEKPEGDISKIPVTDIPKHDILCAGFPCQAFSISGKQKGFEDTRGTLFFDIARIVKHCLPSVVLLENVKNFARHDNGKTLQVVINTLNELGYYVYYKVLNASHYGVPQKRERIYILAIRLDVQAKDYSFPKPTFAPVQLKNILLDNKETVQYVIKRNDVKFRDDLGVQNSFIENSPMKPVRIGTVNKGGQGERIYHENGHAITLSAYGGGIGAKTGLYLIDGKVRKLAPRECARLMGFPDSFIICPSESQAYKQFGNSIVVDVLQHILIDLIKKEIL